MTDYKLTGGVPIIKAGEVSPIIFGLVWGLAGVGKTSLACTLPGRKLLVNFDPRGHQSVAHRSDVDVADFSGLSGRSLTDAFKSDTNPLGLGATLDNYDGYIFDSLSAVSEQATTAGISYVGGKASIERPSVGAYGARNALVLALVSNGLRMCSRANKHCLFIAHEDAPIMNEEGALVSIPVYLGGKLPNNTALRLSEVWAMYDLGTPPRRTIAIRQCRMRSPMKTRMFETNGPAEFTLKYDASKPDDHSSNKGHTISDWHDAWVANGMKKIGLPK